MIRPDPAAAPVSDLVPMTPDHLPQALALSQAAGWPHRLEDWALTLSVSKGVSAFEGGRLVGTAICSAFGPVATLNMIIVAEDRRGMGLGRRLMQHVIALAGGCEMRLTATEDGLPLYRRMGFIERGRIVQHQGLARAMKPERPVRFGPADTDMLAALDTAASGMQRKALLARIAATGDTLRTEGGFALLRAFGRGHVLGPVVARDAGAARALMSAAAEQLAGQFLRVDLSAADPLAPHAEALGLAHVGGGTAMVHSARPCAPSDHHSYALASQALG
ncbi:GNAT family N-acetyltransferase [Pseudotabrizicola sp. 4114]|uniref:GNAT family N-acetyltransferase n=1 Tax=Pseudotabrizicola sp. 4114 TaxID=2817731 RepID=UPI0028602235|nr:GNAT superfamily N-acetyltransferase [Pseudorhodobacter sp. 4114]